MKDLFSSRLKSVAGTLTRRRTVSFTATESSRWWLPMAESPIWARGRWLRQLGWPGLAGAGLLAVCATVYFSGIHPAVLKLNEVQQSAASIQERVKHAARELNHSDLTPAEQLAAFYRIFPKDRELQPWLEKVFAIAQNEGIRLDQGEYRLAREKVGRLVRFQMTLPVRSEYPQLRRYLDTLHAEVPIVAMEHLQFERQKVGDTEVEARIKLAIYLERES